MIACGIEIHQRLATGKKLFCSCGNAPGSEGKEGAVVTRRLRAPAGELGKVDPAAAFEATRSRQFTYHSFPDCTCLVELDEEPPAELNREALEACLKLALAFNAEPVDEIRVMRKTVIDGSATGGFQRTALVATGGSVQTSRGPVSIQTVCLEEESAGIVDRKAGEYGLDRLGIPLIELATAPTIFDGQHARETAEAIGLVLRGSGAVQRGIGTIRQDLNISVDGGKRCEIKGVQELALLPRIIDNEAARQEALGRIAVGVRGKKFGSPVVKSLAGVEAPISPAGPGQVVMGTRLPFIGSLMPMQLTQGHSLGDEIAEYAGVRSGARTFVHSASAAHGSAARAQAVAGALGCSPADGWIAFAGDEQVVVTALESAFTRTTMLVDGVIAETRKADGEHSRFMRPLPGSARMYPETDVPPVAVEAALLSRLRKSVGKGASERVDDYSKLGLQRERAVELVKSDYSQVFDQVVSSCKSVEPAFAASVLLETTKSLRREGVPVDSLKQGVFLDAFKALDRGEIVKAAVGEVLRHAAVEGRADVDALIAEKKLRRMSQAELKALVSRFAGDKLAFEKIMREHRLRVDAQELARLAKATN